jgi:geranylgeranyl pyrophosphate synthase
MTLYTNAIEQLLVYEEAQRWPELNHALQRALVRQPVAWHFPIKACEAVGGAPEKAIPAVAAITCAHMAILLVDDVLDDDPRGEYHRLGAGRASNLAVGLNALGMRVLFDAKDCDQRERAAAGLNAMIGSTAYGQELDVQNARNEEEYWAVAQAKSSPYFGVALYIGALFGGGKIETAEQLNKFGEIYGEIMQIHDDLNDSLATPANIDWFTGRSPLPLLFAQLVDHPDRERFIELRSLVEDEGALQEAQAILVRCGAISFSVHHLIERHRRAKELLERIELNSPEEMHILLDEALAPVKHLFESVGAEYV